MPSTLRTVASCLLSPLSVDSPSSPVSPGAGRPCVVGPKGEGVRAASGTRCGRQAFGKDMSNTCASYTGSKVRSDRKARYLPSWVKTGSVSTNLSSVTSTMEEAGSSSASPTAAARLTARMCRNGSGPGWDQASHLESGEKARSPGSLDSARVTTRMRPLTRSTARSLLSWLVTAAVRPSGETSSASTRPSWPAPILRGSAPGSTPVTGTISSASSPSASVTKTTEAGAFSAACRSDTNRGILARTPGVADSARTGPSRWLTQCTVPLARTALARPVWSGTAAARWSLAVAVVGRRFAPAPVRATSIRRGVPSRSSSNHTSPACW